MQELKRTINDSERVIASKKGNIVTQTEIYTTMKSILNKCKDESVKEVKDKVHALRHTFATTLIQRGAQIPTVSKILGHSDISITLQVYHHVIEQQEIEAINNIDKYFTWE